MSVRGGELLQHLRNLEVALHQATRNNEAQLAPLLHDAFIEFGRSGCIYNKADIVSELPPKKPSGSIWAQDYAVAIIADDVVLLTYKSAHLDETGELSRYTLRSSLWQQTEFGWQMRFHQGTPTDAFAKALT